MHNGHIVAGRKIAFDDAIRRVRSEFVEVPGMQLTAAQAARLWHFEPEFCNAVLTAVVNTTFLVKTRHQTFARA
jgi:hypothetical protein